MAALISSATARAARPSSPETRGAERVRTHSRNDSISRRSGSPAVTGGFWMFRPGRPGSPGQSRRRHLRGIRLCGAGDVDHQQILARVVDRDILMRLKEAQLAHALRADAAGGEVGHAAGFKLDAHVGDIDLRRKESAAPRRAGSGSASAPGSARCRGRGSSGPAPRPRRASAG